MAKTVKKELKANQFQHTNGKLYEVVMPRVNIPAIGVLTAGEMAVDAAAQEYLVANCIGSVIKEIF